MAKRVIKGAISLLSVSDYMKRLNECYNNMMVADNYYSLVIELDAAYLAMKSAAAQICKGKGNFFYEKLRNRVLDCESLCESTFIVESNPDFDLLDLRFTNQSIVDIKKEDLVDYLVWFTRVRLYETHQDEEPEEIIDFNKLHLTNDCKLACNIVGLLCDALNISYEIIKLPPAFTDEYKLYRGNGFHYFCLIKIDGVRYIVDPTYRQFFTLDSNLINRLGVLGLNGCNPGVYMMMDESRKKTALEILKKGYVVATDENLKNYLDGFALSYRNGLYYEWLGEADYTTPYTIDDYFKFIDEEELLFDYEPIEFLGEQDKPLNNAKFRFKN